MASVHDLTDDLLELILLRLPSPVFLVRAAATCTLWRDVIANAGFLRRFHCIHAPVVVAGCYYNKAPTYILKTLSIGPSFDHLSSMASGVDFRHFSLDFVSDTVDGLDDATILDSRGSLLLMEFRIQKLFWHEFLDVLIVCEPLMRRSKKIPPPRDFDADDWKFGSAYLIDGDADKAGGCISMSNFRVLCDMSRGGISHATVFTADAVDSSSPWGSEKNIHHLLPKVDYLRRVMGRAGGSWYFHIGGMTAAAVLDSATGEYSSCALPATEDWDTPKNIFYMTEGRDGEPRNLTLHYTIVKVFARGGSGGDGWALEKRIELRESLRDLLSSDCELPRYVVDPYGEPAYWTLCKWSSGMGFITVVVDTPCRQYFAVDFETMEAKPAAKYNYGEPYQCNLPWPPALSTHTCRLDT